MCEHLYLHNGWCRDCQAQLLPEVEAYKPGLPTDYAARKALPLWTFLTEYFPDAFVEVVKVAVAGDKQHANGGPTIRWERNKSTDQMNTAFRHMFDHATGEAKDTDGCYHLAKAIWRLSAQLQLHLEENS